MIDIKQIAAPLRKDWKCTAVLAAAFAFACWLSAFQIRSELGGAAALLILLACLLYQTAQAATPLPAKQAGFPWHKLPGWLFVVAAIALVFLPWGALDAPAVKFCAWFCYALGGLCLFCGVRTMLLGGVPLLGCFLAVPFREQIVLYLSAPFRMASTVLSVGFLQLFGMKIENEMTTIRIKGLDIAITDACSGIQQFEVMILVAFWLVMAWRRPFVWRCIHYAFLIPSIILANAIRIILTIALYKAGFTAILNNAWHEGLGYVQVVLAVALFFLVGCLLPESGPPDASAGQGGAAKAKAGGKRKETGKGGEGMKKRTENERKSDFAQASAGDARTPAPDTAAVADAATPAGPPWKRLAGAFLAGVPFFITLPYTVKSWRSSPLDRWNWIFLLAFLLLAACVAPAVNDSAKRNRPDYFALLAVAAAAVLYGNGIVLHIHMIQILAGTWLWWAGVWLFCGWPGAWAALPAFAALSLGCTSTTFVLCNHFLISPRTALVLKLGGALLCAADCAFFMLVDFVMKREVFWFLLAAAAILTGTVVSRGGGLTAPPFRPDLTAAPEGLSVSEMPPTQDLVRFFEGAEIHQYRISDNVFRCSVLEVKCGDDIHKIHPASHCLRSGGAVILSESVVMHTLPDGRELPVTEIQSRIGSVRTLTFVWYTGPEETIGSFYLFRRKWRDSDQWRSYQIVTEIFDGNDAAARKFLLDVLSKF